MIEAPVRLAIPGTPEDYFATEVVRLFGLEPPEYEKPQDRDALLSAWIGS